MKLSKQLVERVRAAMDERGMCKMDLAKAAGISHSTVGRWFSGSAKNITDETVELISRVLSIPISELMVLSLGGMPKQVRVHPRRMMVDEDPDKYADIFDRLSVWLRSDASSEGKKAILMMAQAMGFQDTGLTRALDALCEPARSRAG
jgi:transcriptional regulator with XRE-family HTH domain